MEKRADTCDFRIGIDLERQYLVRLRVNELQVVGLQELTLGFDF